MSALLRLLDSNGVTPFVSHNYGNVLAGTQSVPKLVFVDSYGDVNAEGCEFGIEAVPGNDGYAFTEICTAATMSAVASVVTGSVTTTGGDIHAGTNISYKISVVDRWDNESEPSTSAFAPTFATGDTNLCELSWTAVTGAFKYILYSNIEGAGYFKVAEVATNNYTDLNGTNTGATSPKTAGAVAYKVGTWQTLAISLGVIVPATQVPMAVRNNVPLGTSSVGNPRQHKCYVAFLAA